MFIPRSNCCSQPSSGKLVLAWNSDECLEVAVEPSVLSKTFIPILLASGNTVEEGTKWCHSWKAGRRADKCCLWSTIEPLQGWFQQLPSSSGPCMRLGCPQSFMDSRGDRGTLHLPVKLSVNDSDRRTVMAFGCVPTSGESPTDANEPFQIHSHTDSPLGSQRAIKQDAKVRVWGRDLSGGQENDGQKGDRAESNQNALYMWT